MELPVGISDFRKLVEYRNRYTGESYLYVDKTSFIKEIDHDGSEVIVITRPRRFGKTINMSMLQYFYAAEVDGQSTAGMFNELEISKDPDAMKGQGSCPVIFVSFKDVDGDDFEEALESLLDEIKFLYSQHAYLLESTKLTDYDKDFIDKILKENAASKPRIKKSLKNLTVYLKKHYSKNVMLLIDEYDAPIQRAYSKNYYEQIISVFRGMFGGALKGNAAVEKTILTGIIRVSKESLFSSVNNVEIYSVLDTKYSEYFGFNELEVADMLRRSNIDALNKAREWYNGYVFGDSVVYNPWSVVKFIKDQGIMKSNWINTGSKTIVQDLILNADKNIKEKLEILMQNGTIHELIDEHVVFSDLKTNSSALWSLLLASGYLMCVSKEYQGDFINCKLKIPNREVLSFYCNIVQTWISAGGGIAWFQGFIKALKTGRAIDIEKKLQEVMDHMMSYHDKAENLLESYFHGLMLGIVVALKDEYKIKSNRESGMGRYDLALFPNDKNNSGIVMEFKNEHTKKDKSEALAQEALQQLVDLDYNRELQEEGITNIVSLGVGFTKNKVCVLEAK